MYSNTRKDLAKIKNFNDVEKSVKDNSWQEAVFAMNKKGLKRVVKILQKSV